MQKTPSTDGYRWRLVVSRGNEDIYAAYSNSPVQMASYLMEHLGKGRRPQEPWAVRFEFGQEDFEPESDDVTSDGKYVTPAFIRKIEAIDPAWRESPSDLLAIDLQTGDPLPEPYEISLGTVLYDVFRPQR